MDSSYNSNEYIGSLLRILLSKTIPQLILDSDEFKSYIENNLPNDMLYGIKRKLMINNTEIDIKSLLNRNSIIVGEGGIGKSVYCYNLAKTIFDEYYLTGIIPLFIDGDDINEVSTYEKINLETILSSRYNFKNINIPINTKWVIIIDAIDQINSSSVRNKIVGLINKNREYKGRKINNFIVSTRPDYYDHSKLNNLTNPKISITPLSQNEIDSILMEYIEDQQIRKQIVENFYELLKNPLYLNFFVKAKIDNRQNLHLMNKAKDLTIILEHYIEYILETDIMIEGENLRKNDRLKVKRLIKHFAYTIQSKILNRKTVINEDDFYRELFISANASTFAGYEEDFKEELIEKLSDTLLFAKKDQGYQFYHQLIKQIFIANYLVSLNSEEIKNLFRNRENEWILRSSEREILQMIATLSDDQKYMENLLIALLEKCNSDNHSIITQIVQCYSNYNYYQEKDRGIKEEVVKKIAKKLVQQIWFINSKEMEMIQKELLKLYNKKRDHQLLDFLFHELKDKVIFVIRQLTHIITDIARNENNTELKLLYINKYQEWFKNTNNIVLKFEIIISLSELKHPMLEDFYKEIFFTYEEYFIKSYVIYALYKNGNTEMAEQLIETDSIFADSNHSYSELLEDDLTIQIKSSKSHEEIAFDLLNQNNNEIEIEHIIDDIIKSLFNMSKSDEIFVYRRKYSSLLIEIDAELAIIRLGKFLNKKLRENNDTDQLFIIVNAMRIIGKVPKNINPAKIFLDSNISRHVKESLSSVIAISKHYIIDIRDLKEILKHVNIRTQLNLFEQLFKLKYIYKIEEYDNVDFSSYINNTALTKLYELWNRYLIQSSNSDE